MAENGSGRPVILQLRVAITSSDFARSLKFYSEGLGMEITADWSSGSNRAVMFETGRGTLELFNEHQAELVDTVETGRRVSGVVRLAIQVPDLDEAIARLTAAGASLLHAPVVTPWGDRNARVEDPDGLQVTLFEVPRPPRPSRPARSS